MSERPELPPIEDQEAKLERAFEDEYLGQIRRTRDEVELLPEEERRAILRAAVSYASERLAEIGARARYVHELHRDG